MPLYAVGQSSIDVSPKREVRVVSDVIELYEKYKKRKSGSLVLNWAEFDELLHHIENTEWNAEENPHPTYEYQGDKVVLHL